MNLQADKPLWRFKWHGIIIYVVLIIVVLLTVFTNVFQTSEGGFVPQIIWFLSGLLVLAAVLMILLKIIRILDAVRETGAQLEQVTEAVEKNRAVLAKINQNTRLSEKAKAIASRDIDRQALREVIFDKLQQQDFDTTYEIIDEIARSSVYHDLAEQLRRDAEKYRDASAAERINQVLAHIEKLLDDCQWAKASALIERLIKAEPDSEKAKQMRQRLVDKKQERKKILLTAWDDAVKRQATDRSLEILRELDMYLTPNEGLALQEAARDVFRNKLHNLGVQFSLAVSEKKWAKALQTGMVIIRDFPNSRMAEEIRERMDILKQNVEQQL